MFRDLVQECRVFLGETEGKRIPAGARVKAAKLHTRSASNHEDGLAAKKHDDISQADHYTAAHHHGRARDAWWNIAKTHSDWGLRQKANKMGDWHSGRHDYHRRHAHLKSYGSQELGTSAKVRKALYGKGKRVRRDEVPRSR